MTLWPGNHQCSYQNNQTANNFSKIHIFNEYFVKIGSWAIFSERSPWPWQLWLLSCCFLGVQMEDQWGKCQFLTALTFLNLSSLDTTLRHASNNNEEKVLGHSQISLYCHSFLDTSLQYSPMGAFITWPLFPSVSTSPITDLPRAMLRSHGGPGPFILMDFWIKELQGTTAWTTNPA